MYNNSKAVTMTTLRDSISKIQKTPDFGKIAFSNRFFCFSLSKLSFRFFFKILILVFGLEAEKSAISKQILTYKSTAGGLKSDR